MKRQRGYSIVGLMILLLVCVSVFSVQAQDPICQQYHTISPGETLYSIALRYNTNIATLQSLNTISNPNRIFAGRKLCVSTTIVLPPSSTPMQYTGIVNTDLLNVRSGPNVNNTIVRHVRRGDVLQLVGRTADGLWLQIPNHPSGSFQWVMAAYITVDNITAVPVIQGSAQPPAENPINETVVMNTPIYMGPHTQYATSGYLYAGQTVGIVGRNVDTSWYMLQTDQGFGWVPASTFVEAVKYYFFPITG